MEKHVNVNIREQLPKRFMAISLFVLLLSIFIYLAISFTNLSSLNQPGQDIFRQDAITASKTGDMPEALVPVGITAGVRFYTQGIVVLGAGDVAIAGGQTVSPSKGKLLPGDVVTKVCGECVQTISEMVSAISKSKGNVNLEILRDGKAQVVEITPAKSADDGAFKIGCWVRDSTQGIGTITYYDPATKSFGALGHGILDVDTQKLLTVREGQLLESKIIDVRKGKKGAPGELIGEINERTTIGQITHNTPLGIYGQIDTAYRNLPTTTFTLANLNEIARGPAQILSNIEGGGIEKYDVFIESINNDTSAEKAMVIRITDQRLIARTNGIVQGMSGSPITQNNKFIGAITHVFVQNPQRGYGVDIQKMIKQNLK